MPAAVTTFLGVSLNQLTAALLTRTSKRFSAAENRSTAGLIVDRSDRSSFKNSTRPELPGKAFLILETAVAALESERPAIQTVALCS